jgi:hypothetical protein
VEGSWSELVEAGAERMLEMERQEWPANYGAVGTTADGTRKAVGVQ